MVLSSYTFMENGADGFPDGHSDCSRIGNPVIFLFSFSYFSSSFSKHVYWKN